LKSVKPILLKLALIVALNTKLVARKETTGWKRVCSCGADVDRDLNGARGIFLRALAVTP